MKLDLEGAIKSTPGHTVNAAKTIAKYATGADIITDAVHVIKSDQGKVGKAGNLFALTVSLASRYAGHLMLLGSSYEARNAFHAAQNDLIEYYGKDATGHALVSAFLVPVSAVFYIISVQLRDTPNQ